MSACCDGRLSAELAEADGGVLRKLAVEANKAGFEADDRFHKSNERNANRLLVLVQVGEASHGADVVGPSPDLYRGRRRRG